MKRLTIKVHLRRCSPREILNVLQGTPRTSLGSRLASGTFLVSLLAVWGCGSLSALIPWNSPEQHVIENEYGEDASTMSHLIASEVDEEGHRLIAKDHFAEAGKFDIPVVYNDKVQAWLDYFQGPGRQSYERYLARSGRYVPMMRKILKDHGLPEDLVYLAMIESGFNPQAYSRARATGPWQFIYSTGRRYGLKVDRWIDERRDPEKSTIAAARYLKDLYDRFDDWYLAAAGYNAGEGKIGKAIRRYRTEDFWELTGRRERYIRQETRDYVPKLIAAAAIAKNPERYGFKGVDYHPPIVYEKAAIAHPVKLAVIARCADVDLGDIQHLNPELKRMITPPHYQGYEIKLPKGSLHRFEKNFARLSDDEKFVDERTVKTAGQPAKRVVRYRVRPGENLTSIAEKHRVRISDLEAWNGVDRHATLKPGKVLKIRVRSGETVSL